MGLSDEAKESLIKAMLVTKKNIKSAFKDGGFFYFVADSKGEDSALIIFNETRDAEGKKTFRVGRQMMKTFKKGGSKPFYSQGKITSDGNVTFHISKGNVKPSTIKRAFKMSDLLGAGVGSTFAKLKSVKLKKTLTPDHALSSIDSTISTEAHERWEASDEVQALIKELDLSPEEVAELFAAEQAFNAYMETLPISAEEDSALQIRQAETEAVLDALAAGEEELAALKLIDQTAALALENQLNVRRIELAQRNAIGEELFQADQLSPVDRQALHAAIHGGLDLLFQRAQAAHTEIGRQQEHIDGLDGEGRESAIEIIDGLIDGLGTELGVIRRSMESTLT